MPFEMVSPKIIKQNVDVELLQQDNKGGLDQGNTEES